jgi:hypothetical protein
MIKKLSAKELLAIPNASDEHLDVEIPEVGTITVKALSLQEHRTIRTECFQGDRFDESRWYALLIQSSLIEPALTYDEAMLLTMKQVGFMNLIVNAILEVSGLTESGRISKAAVDDAEESFRDERDESDDIPAS